MSMLRGVRPRPLPSVVALAVLLLSTGRVPAQEMLRKDRLQILYSNQVIFDRRGEPLVSVRLLEGQTAVRFRSAKPLTLLPGADDGSRVVAPANASWVVRVEGAQPGRTRAWVAVERFGAAHMIGAASARDRWVGLGHEVGIFESGAVIGLGGRTLDTRALSLGIDPVADPAVAARNAERLSRKTPILGDIITESIERPTGWIVARETRSGMEVRARDLLWLSPISAEGEVEIVDAVWPHRGKGTRRYRGEVYFTVGNDGRLTVANLANAEALIEGTVPSEIYPSAPMEALKAQAVAARGQLLSKVGTRHRSDPYLLCAETHCQVYSGVGQATPRTSEAVRATRGQVLFDEAGLTDTVYSSACGGHSEAFHNIWGGEPQAALGGILDAGGALGGHHQPVDEGGVTEWIARPPAKAWCGQAAGAKSVFRWSVRRSGAKVTAAVNALAPVGPVHTIRPVRRGVSGRALAIEYIGARGRHVVEGEYPNRLLLGRLKSGMWVVRREGGRADGQPGAWVFDGGGFGHGVGLCQHGSIGQAAAGRTYVEILKHYYVGSQLETVW